MYIVHYGAGISVLQRHWVAFRRFISPPEEREKVGLYSYLKICTKELPNTGACFWSTPWWQLEQEDKFDRVHAGPESAYCILSRTISRQLYVQHARDWPLIQSISS